MTNLAKTFSDRYKSIAIVGKGAVGSAIAQSLDYLSINYDVYDSSNIEEIFDNCYDLLIYSGVNASKYHADRNPVTDKLHCLRAYDIFKNISAEEKILISTIDSSRSFEQSSAYGINRRLLETKIFQDRELFGNSKILRLPALYGSTVKKNAWYDSVKGADLITLNDDLLAKIDSECKKYHLDRINYNILSFVNPQSEFAWYHLDTILRTIDRVTKSNEHVYQVISYDEAHKSGLLISHKELIERLGYRVEFISDSKILKYQSALFDENVYLMFEKSERNMYDEQWKEILE